MGFEQATPTLARPSGDAEYRTRGKSGLRHLLSCYFDVDRADIDGGSYQGEPNRTSVEIEHTRLREPMKYGNG